MKKIALLLYCLIPTAACLLPTADGQQPKKLTKYVNPFIGTGGHGHTFPGAALPFGACQLSPDTRLEGWDGCSGYHYSDSVIYGFSHTHLSGTGCSDYGDILLMPTTKEVSMKNYDYASVFSHKNEHAGAGHYSVLLDKWNIGVNLTCTKRVGIHEYNFPAGKEQFVVLDLKHRDEVLDSKLEVVNDSTVRGYRFSKAWAKNQKVFFYMQFSRPFKEVRYATDQKPGSETSPIIFERQLHALFFFGKNDQPLLVKVGISGVDEEGAEKNMEAEAPGWDFDQYVKQADLAWEKELSKIKINSAIDQSDNLRNTNNWQIDLLSNSFIVFYTALYHTMIHPSIYNDVDGRYRGRDDKLHNTQGKFDYYTVFSLWDTYRALHPLLSILDKKRTNDFINTFIKQYEQGGRLPIWELSSNETNCMIGYHVVSVIWDAYNKGIRDYDAELAFEAMKSIATDNEDYKMKDGVLTMKEEARERCADADALESYNRFGYVRSDDSHESVSKTLEYAYDDWCIAQMANALGHDKDYEYYLKRSHNWMNVYDPTTGFMRARKNGSLYEPFSPYTVDNNYTEANSWQYSFYVPHDIQKLIELHGGKEKFEKHLDDLFSAKEKTEGREQADITGLIGQYAHGNEPSHQLAYLYKYIGKPEKTQRLIDTILNNFYTNSPDGLIGNEDCGQMSAWYVMNALGMYSVCPGNDYYISALPQFNDIKIKADDTAFSLSREEGITGNKYSSYETGLFPVKPKGLHHEAEDWPLDTVKRRNYPSLIRVDKNIYSYSYTKDKEIERYNMEDIYHAHAGTNKADLEKEVSVPFVYGSPSVFKESGLLKFAGLCKGCEIYYSMNGKPYERYMEPVSIRENTHISFYNRLNFADSLVINNEDGSIRSHYYDEKILKSPIQIASFTKLPNDRHVTLKSTFNNSYSAGGADAMIDGIYGKTNWRAGNWQGYQGQDVETIISFDKPKEIKSISAGFLEDQNSWIFYPKAVSFYVSNDSVNWTLIETILTNKSDHEEKVTISKFTANCQLTTAHYIKMIARNFGPMPQWHEGRGNETFVFIDEIEIK